LSSKFGLSLISGDNDGQKTKLISLFPIGSDLQFKQSPKDKMYYIEELQSKNRNVMMVGDGLNDAGALKKSNVGVALAEDVNAFSPACDMILSADAFNQLDQILEFGKAAKRIVIVSFVISFLYNIVGLSFAVQGLLSPVTAAILMPISSISVVGFSTVAVWLASRKVKRG
jgi:Cu+-exporting ATPase